MSHSRTLDAIVMRTYDIGEADRFVILFTRELGKLSARASAVRRPTSAIGGSLLPFRHVRVQLKEWKDSFIIEGVSPSEHDTLQMHDLDWFTSAQRGMELLLQLTQDGEPLPEVFGALLLFLHTCGDHPQSVLAFTIHLLALLGLFPEAQELDEFRLSVPELDFIRAALTGEYASVPVIPERSRLHNLCLRIIADQGIGTLKSDGIGAMMMS